METSGASASRWQAACDLVNGRARDQRAWRESSSFEDLGACVIEWLNGVRPFNPGHVGRPDPETAEIQATLVALNRSGLVTLNSQPQEDRGNWRQRAFVDLVGTAATIDRVRQACQDAGLIAIAGDFAPPACRPFRRRRAHVVSRERQLVGWRRVSWAGFAITQDMAWPGFVFNEAMQRKLDTARSLSAIDPDWTRRDRLWETLAALCERPSPSTDERQGEDDR